ncbi:MAG TPA: trypsin-like peptidase domain-containing protein [Halanaerobiales bacterium]|nr:trypsin-like peptidase domain-containing protein [Halanaerobiales bacterium]
MKLYKNILNNKYKFVIVVSIIFILAFSNLLIAQEEVIEETNETVYVYQENIFADIAAEVDAGVVKITTITKRSQAEMQNPLYDDPFFRYFFGDQLPDLPENIEGYGSGFIVTEGGFIVTNEHVIHEADQIKVNINGMDKSVPAEVIWTDYNLDLAVIKINVDQKLKTIPLGNSKEIRPGEWVIAIGNPFGFEHTVTTGVISALGRPIQIPTSQGQVRTYKNLIQTDAAINPGNSGGPLLNIKGEVIGINTAVSAQGQGIGFAIPVNEVKEVVNDLQTKGEIIQPWLGVSVGQISPEVQEYFDLESNKGAIILDVFPGSPADKAGLKTYDIIKEIDQERIENPDDVVEKIGQKEIEERVLIQVIRDGETEILFARIGRKPNKM